MAVYEYFGLAIDIPENDSEYGGYFEAAKNHHLVVRRCLSCGLLRAEPGASCEWCPSMQWVWHPVSGKGTIFSYQIVAHTVLAGFRKWTPFPIVLVELDEQRGLPSKDDGLRITANLLNSNLKPELEENVAIGKRVDVMFVDLDCGLTLPQFRLVDEPPEGPVWRYPIYGNPVVT